VIQQKCPFIFMSLIQKNQMCGVLSLRQLLIHPPKTQLKYIMNQSYIFLTPDTDQEVLAQLVLECNYLDLLVLDSRMVIKGVITVDDIIDVIKEESTKDMLKMAGEGEDEDMLLQSTIESIKMRYQWLLTGWVGDVCALWIIDSYASTLRQTVLLIAFIHVIIGMGGNVGTQTITIIVPGIATGHLNIGRNSSVIVKKVSIRVIMGGIYGLLFGSSPMSNTHKSRTQLCYH